MVEPRSQRGVDWCVTDLVQDLHDKQQTQLIVRDGRKADTPDDKDERRISDGSHPAGCERTTCTSGR